MTKSIIRKEQRPPRLLKIGFPRCLIGLTFGSRQTEKMNLFTHKQHHKPSPYFNNYNVLNTSLVLHEKIICYSLTGRPIFSALINSRVK